MDNTERRITNRLVLDAVKTKRYVVSVNDGGSFTVCYSSNINEITRALGTTDSDTLHFSKIEGDTITRIGSVDLVYGNGCDVISDYSDNTLMEELTNGAFELAGLIESGRR